MVSNSVLTVDIVDYEEKTILSRRRSVIFIFFLGVIFLCLLFLLRIDMDKKHGMVGHEAWIVKGVTPIFVEHVGMVMSNIADADVTHTKDIRYHQRDPSLLLAALYGTYWNRPVHYM